MNLLVHTTQKTRQIRKLMIFVSNPVSIKSPLSFTKPSHTLHQTPTLASPPWSTPSNLHSLHTKMSFTTIDGNYELEPIFKQKKILRSKIRKSLKEMDLSQRSHEDDIIQRIVLDAPWFKASKRLCAYISCRPLREVDTSKLLAEILQSSDKEGEVLGRKTLYVPRVEDKNSHMRMLNITGMDDLIANSMDILEPAAIDSDGNLREDVMEANQPVDLLLLPGLAFDRSGRRIGRGGGYYDTFLNNYQQLVRERNWKQPLLVALSYSVQILDDGVIPVTPNDVYIDAIVSPTGIFPISSGALSRMENGV